MAKPPVDTNSLLAALRLAHPMATHVAPLSEGEDSRAFTFTSEQDRYVARVNSTCLGFEKDRLAFELFSAPDLPVPEVVSIAPFGKSAWLCVSRWIEGDTLQALSADAAFAYGQAVGRLMDRIAIAPANGSGAGQFDRNGHGHWATWPRFITDVSNWTWTGLSVPERRSVAQVIAIIEGTAGSLPDRRQLVHGDFGSNNVLVARGRITAVIDWSEAMIGDPLYDLANLLFWRPWLDCMEQQCRYFELHEPERLEQVEILRCYQLRIGLQLVRDAMADGDRDMAEWALARCAEVARSPITAGR